MPNHHRAQPNQVFTPVLRLSAAPRPSRLPSGQPPNLAGFPRGIAPSQKQATGAKKGSGHQAKEFSGLAAFHGQPCPRLPSHVCIMKLAARRAFISGKGRPPCYGDDAKNTSMTMDLYRPAFGGMPKQWASSFRSIRWIFYLCALTKRGRRWG